MREPQTEQEINSNPNYDYRDWDDARIAEHAHKENCSEWKRYFDEYCALLVLKKVSEAEEMFKNRKVDCDLCNLLIEARADIGRKWLLQYK